MSNTNVLSRKGIIVKREDLIGAVLPTSYASPGGSHWKSYSATKVVEIKELSVDSDMEILLKYATVDMGFVFELKAASPCGWNFAIAFQVDKIKELLNISSFLLWAKYQEINPQILLDIIAENVPKK